MILLKNNANKDVQDAKVCQHPIIQCFPMFFDHALPHYLKDFYACQCLPPPKPSLHKFSKSICSVCFPKIFRLCPHPLLVGHMPHTGKYCHSMWLLPFCLSDCLSIVVQEIRELMACLVVSGLHLLMVCECGVY